jgi:hypothetical protein
MLTDYGLKSLIPLGYLISGRGLVRLSATSLRPRERLFRDGGRSRELLDRLKNWMARNSALIMAVLLLIIGVKLIGDWDRRPPGLNDRSRGRRDLVAAAVGAGTEP